MINRKKFIEELDRFEVINKFDVSEEELKAIVKVCANDADPIYLAAYLGFQCGCMKVGGQRE